MRAGGRKCLVTRQELPLPEPVNSLLLRRRLPRVARALAVLALLCTSIGLSTSPFARADAPSRRTACAKSYTVVSGDSWFAIAKKVAVTLTALFDANAATATTAIYPGTVLCLPDSATTVPTTAPTTTTTTPATAGVTTTTVAGGQVVSITAFPIQGPCWFTDTWHAPRSGGRLHEGVDVIAKSGLYVYAVVDGTLTKQAWDKPGALAGNAWWLTAADGTYFFYAHMSAFAPDLSIGSKVVAGQIIGYVGETGSAAAPHMHFEVHPSGGPAIDPTPTVKAVDGCANKDPLAQPSGSVPPAPAPPTSAGATTVPANTGPATTGPATTAPANTGPANTGPANTGSAGATSAGSLWSFISPVTAFDTSRTGKRVAGGTTTKIAIGNLKGVLASTGGVMVRLTTKGAASGGYLVMHRCDIAAPLTASLTFPAATGVVGTTVVAATAGSICMTSNVSLAVKVEIIAWRSASGVGLRAVRSTRALDTRLTKRLQPGASVTIDPTKLGVVPGTQALSTTITFVNPAKAGTFSIGFCGSGPWTVPFSSDSLSSFSLAMRVTGTGWCISSTVAVDVVVDVTGIWTGSDGSPSPIDPVRVYDSRTVGVQVGPAPVTVPVAGQGGIPAGATTALISISTVTGGNPGIVFLVPCGQDRSEGAAAVGAPRRIVTAVVPVQLGGGAVCISALQPVDVIVDVVGAT